MSVLPEPTMIIEAGFSVGASTGTYLHLDDPARGLLDTATLAPDTVWTDITQWAWSGSISRSSTRIESPIITYETGTASIVLDNLDRRFDPTNLAGPYVAAGVTQVRPRRGLRIRATWNGITYDLFRGLADEWPMNWIDPGDSECNVTASDGFAVFAGIDRTAVAAIGSGETTGARVGRILDSVGWASADRIVATGDSTVQATTLEGDALTELQATTDSEIGELYVDGAGHVVFRNRTALLTDTRSNTSQAVFGDADGELPMWSVAVSTDYVTFYNDIRVTRTGGTEQVAMDSASQAQDFTRTFRPSEVILQDDADVLAYAQWLLYISKDPEVRFTELEIHPSMQPDDLYPQVLGREIGDRITIRRRPPGGGSLIERDCFIRGISHEFAQGSWVTKWQLQSATKYGSFLTLDNAILGKLDENALAF